MNSSADRTVDPTLRPSVTNGSHAVVLGGSMAGLLAARVLTDHFEQVTIVERTLSGNSGAAPGNSTSEPCSRFITSGPANP